MKKAVILSLFLGFSSVSAQFGMQRYWKQLGPISFPVNGVDSGQWTANGMGWIESLEVYEKNPQIIYAGSNTGGLYRTRNGGKTWKFVFDVERLCGVTDIVIDDADPNHVWVATGTTTWDYDWGLGVLETFNGGRSWTTTGLYFRPKQRVPLWCLEQSTYNPNVFYACSETDIYKSSDRCKTWKMVYKSSIERVHFRHLSIHADDPNKVVASGDLVLTTEDGGANWHDHTLKLDYWNQKSATDSLPGRFAHALNPQNNNEIILAYSYRYRDYIQRSNDFGKTWQLILKRSTFNRLDRTHSEVAWHPSDSNILFVGSVRVYRSSDLGKTFQVVSQPRFRAPDFMHDDIRALLLMPDGTIYTGNDGGVGKSTDNGRTWTDISGYGLTVTQFFDIAVDSGRIAGGCQDLSSMMYVDGNWLNTSQIYGDGGSNLILNDEVYVMHAGHLQRGTFANENWQRIGVPFNPGRFSYPFAVNPWDSGKIWATDHHLWEYDLETRHWRNLSQSIQPGLTKIVALATDVENQFVYMAKDQPTWDPSEQGLHGRLYKGVLDQGMIRWEDITQRLGIVAWRSIKGIWVNPQNGKEIFIALEGFDDTDRRFKVYRSMNGGEDFQNVSEGLPNCLALCLGEVVNGLYPLLGTDGGIFYYDRKKSVWKRFGKRMPALHITDIVVDPQTKSIYTSTYGGGVWQMTLPRRMR